MLNWIFQNVAGGCTSPKTTLTATVAAIAIFLGQMGIVNIDAQAQMAIVTVALVVIGWFSKDANKTGLPLDED